MACTVSMWYGAFHRRCVSASRGCVYAFCYQRKPSKRRQTIRDLFIYASNTHSTKGDCTAAHRHAVVSCHSKNTSRLADCALELLSATLLFSSSRDIHYGYKRVSRPVVTESDYDDSFILPHALQVHQRFSMNVPQLPQSQPACFALSWPAWPASMASIRCRFRDCGGSPESE